MVRYLKYIVLVFGGLGIIIASFFFFQNKQDIMRAYAYKDRIDYAYLRNTCEKKVNNSIFLCLKDEFEQYLKKVSLSGTGFGLKMVFNVLEKDKVNSKGFSSSYVKDFTYSLNHLEINNLAMGNVYKRYYGFSFLYGGFISSLNQYYLKANRFNQDIIAGLEGVKGLTLIKDQKEYKKLNDRLRKIKKNYYDIKKEAELFIENEWLRLQAQSDHKKGSIL